MKAAVVSLGSPHDPLLHRIGPLALAASAPVGLVIDVDPGAPPLPGTTTLAGLCADGLHARHLSPPRRGVAVLPNGGVDRSVARAVIDALIEAWPAVVLREAHPEIEVIPLIPGMPVPTPLRPAVFQPSGRWIESPGRGLVLPSLRRSVASCLIRGSIPLDRRWISAWAKVWEGRWA